MFILRKSVVHFSNALLIFIGDDVDAVGVCP